MPGPSLWYVSPKCAPRVASPAIARMLWLDEPIVEGTMERPRRAARQLAEVLGQVAHTSSTLDSAPPALTGDLLPFLQQEPWEVLRGPTPEIAAGLRAAELAGTELHVAYRDPHRDHIHVWRWDGEILIKVAEKVARLLDSERAYTRSALHNPHYVGD